MFGYSRKVWPCVVIEQVPADPRKNPLGAEDRYWLVIGPKGVLDQERKGICVIHVSVCDQHVAHLPLLGDRQSAGDGPGIDRHLTINQEGGHPALGTVAPKAPKNPKIHAPSITGKARVL
jgi:hypothetical protein